MPDGGDCVIGQGRVVSGHVGGIDGGDGVFYDLESQSNECRQSMALTRGRPIDVGWGYASGDPHAVDPFDRNARIERRLQTGRSDVTVRCSPDVRSVTISTPRDTRVLRPSPVGHVVFAVYDGNFASGSLVVTATLRDGSHFRQAFPTGP
jgi:hypothetical protein